MKPLIYAAFSVMLVRSNDTPQTLQSGHFVVMPPEFIADSISGSPCFMSKLGST